MTSDDETVRWLVERMGQAEAEALIAEMEAAGQPLSLLDDLRSAATKLPIHPAPGGVTDDLLAMFEERERTSYELVLAAAPSDLVATRGATVADGSSLLFQCEVADVLVDITPASSDQVTLEIQILGRAPGLDRAALHLTGPLNRDLAGDELGRFVAADLPPGQYRLTLTAPELVMVTDLTLEPA